MEKEEKEMKNTIKVALAVAVIAVIVVAVFAYINSQSPSSEGLQPAALHGAGATFPAPFINATIQYYQSHIRTNVQIDYQGVGSGQGVTSFTNRVVDFAGSDAPLTASQRQAAPNALHIPETIGAITVAYNLPSISTSVLNLTGPVVADIYLGVIANWNDVAISSLNPGITLPDHSIGVVYRSDASGTTNWFTKYLCLVSSQWNNTIHSGTTVEWPVGSGAPGNSGVATQVNTTQYSVGYVELAYAIKNGMTVAALKNPAGHYVLPSLASTTAAASSLPTSGLPSGSDSWENVNILNSPGGQAYPIVTPTYLLVYKDLKTVTGMDINKATQLVQYLWYVVHGGQQLARALEYATLPQNIVQIDEATLNSITFDGQPVPTH